MSSSGEKYKGNSKNSEAERNTYLYRYRFKCSMGHNRRDTAIYGSFFIDVKAGTEDTHRKYTGVTNRMIKENLKKLSQEADIWIRIPMVHNVNDTEQELDEIIKYISSLGDGVKKIQLLKYHSLGKMKYQWIGKECVKFEEPDEVHREYILSRMRKLPFYVEWN